MKIKNALHRLRYHASQLKGRSKEAAFYDWFYEERPRLLAFQDKHKNEDCFIIGNGPSLNRMDLEKLNPYTTFGLNKIYLIFKRVQLALNYLVAVNPHIIEQSKEAFYNLTFPCFLSYQPSKEWESTGHLYKIYTRNPLQFCPTLMHPVAEGYTVTYVAMQIAYYMGFKRVFLIGVDHNFKQQGSPNELQIHQNEDVNHFDPDYFKGQAWQLADLEGSEMYFSMARFAYERSNRQIFDATLDGKLQVFQKITFAEALNMAQPGKG